MNFSLVIPTYNRLEDLEKCLVSVLVQTVSPAELLIIDDGALPQEFINTWRDKLGLKSITLVYYQKNHELERRGLSESKNKALELVANEIFFMLDDDVTLETDFCARIMNVWTEKSGDDKLIGVGGIIKNHRARSGFEKFFHAFFGLGSKFAWDVNPVAFQVWDEDIKEPTLGYYAHGGVSAYRLSLARSLKFSTFSGGRTALEDVDFCLRAKSAGYHFIIEPAARLGHYPSAVAREKMFLIGQKESHNRWLIFRTINKKPSIFLRAWFAWANLGWILRQFLSGNFKKGLGMARGAHLFW